MGCGTGPASVENNYQLAPSSQNDGFEAEEFWVATSPLRWLNRNQPHLSPLAFQWTAFDLMVQSHGSQILQSLGLPQNDSST